MTDKKVLGLTEDIVVVGPEGEKTVHARIDTGATSSSMDAALAAELELGPIAEVKKIKSANGMKVRPAIKATVRIAGEEFTSIFSLADRSHMSYQALIGQDILRQGFLIDPDKNTLVEEE